MTSNLGIEMEHAASPWEGMGISLETKNSSNSQVPLTTTKPTHHSEQSNMRQRNIISKLQKLGADAEDLDEDWLRLQTKTAQAEERRRTSHKFIIAPTAENPVASTTHHKADSENHHGEVYHPPHHSFSEVEKQLMNQYESLDYDVVNSELSEQELAHRTYWTVKCDWIAKWFIFGLIGALTGTLAALTAYAVESLNEKKFETALGFLRAGETATACVFFVGISMAFGLIATLLVNFVEPVAAGSGIPQLKGKMKSGV